ncbi:P-loop NTPase [Salinigranum salinum]|uniref:P-loop NTPase n=1 Tax=Salinigranum salinum TaxID=1364937 RepID=UPI00126042DD|nr:P-loop NTPase [Salinigranum salinum]
MADGSVFAIAGAKGGVGKTTTSINLSAVLAEMGHSVLLVELDIAMANVGDFLDLDVRLEDGEDPTLHDVLAGTASVASATYEAPGGFDVVPSGTTLEGFSRADIDRAPAVVAHARARYDVVVLDTGAGLGSETVLPLSLADETILVSSPRVASVRDTKKTRNLVRHVDGTVAGVVFVKSGSGRSPGVERIAEFLAVDLLGHVPEDPAVASAQDIGRPVVVAASDSAAAKAYGALGSRIHDRIKQLRATQAADAKRAAAASTAPDGVASNGATDGPDTDGALSTTDEEADGFSFVADADDSDAVDTDDSDAADTDDSDAADANGSDAVDETGAIDRPATAGVDASNETVSDTTTAPAEANGHAASTDGRRRESGTDDRGAGTGRNAGRRTVQTGRQPAGESRGDDREVVGATDEEVAERLAAVEADEDGDGEDRKPGGDEADEDWDSKQSAAKRFIDKAIGIVDRRGD